MLQERCILMLPSCTSFLKFMYTLHSIMLSDHDIAAGHIQAPAVEKQNARQHQAVPCACILALPLA